MKTIRYLLMPLAMVLQGCITDVVDLFPGNQPIPPETVSEVLVRGASIGSLNPRHKPLPEEIGAELNSDEFIDVSGGELALLIMPTDFVLESKELGDFYYAFSKDIGDGVFQILPNRRFSGNGAALLENIELRETLEFLPGMESLSEIADFYLLESGNLFIPAEATHLELRFLANDGLDAFLTIERWDLQDFHGYTMYIRPLIDEVTD